MLCSCGREDYRGQARKYWEDEEEFRLVHEVLEKMLVGLALCRSRYVAKVVMVLIPVLRQGIIGIPALHP
jgi:hypothetical protein